MLDDNWKDDIHKYISKEELIHINTQTVELSESIEKYLLEYFGGSLLSIFDHASVVDALRLLNIKYNSLLSFGYYLRDPKLQLSELIEDMEKQIDEDAYVVKCGVAEQLYRNADRIIKEVFDAE